MSCASVIVEMSGGLGNQLFQLGAADSLARAGNVVMVDSYRTSSGSNEVKNVDTLLERLGLRRFERGKIAQIGLNIGWFKRLYLVYLRLITHRSNSTFDVPRLSTFRNRRRIAGYWQSKEVAKPIAVLIGTTFPKLEPRQEIAIHVRRGDYLSPLHSMHGVLSGDYYLKALKSLNIEPMQQRITIFTDSQDTVRKESWTEKLNYANIEFSPLTDPWETLMEMSRYTSIICSNSTFSWWAAFLGQEKNIVLPSFWFKGYHLPSSLHIDGSTVVEASFQNLS